MRTNARRLSSVDRIAITLGILAMQRSSLRSIIIFHESRERLRSRRFRRVYTKDVLVSYVTALLLRIRPLIIIARRN